MAHEPVHKVVPDMVELEDIEELADTLADLAHPNQEVAVVPSRVVELVEKQLEVDILVGPDNLVLVVDHNRYSEDSDWRVDCSFAFSLEGIHRQFDDTFFIVSNVL